MKRTYKNKKVNTRRFKRGLNTMTKNHLPMITRRKSGGTKLNEVISDYNKYIITDDEDHNQYESIDVVSDDEKTEEEAEAAEEDETEEQSEEDSDEEELELIDEFQLPTKKPLQIFPIYRSILFSSSDIGKHFFRPYSSSPFYKRSSLSVVNHPLTCFLEKNACEITPEFDKLFGYTTRFDQVQKHILNSKNRLADSVYWFNQLHDHVTYKGIHLHSPSHVYFTKEHPDEDYIDELHLVCQNPDENSFSV